MYDIAYRLFEQGCYAEAEELYRQMLQRNPHDLNACNAFAFLLRHTGRAHEAINVLRGCLKKHPESLHLLLHLGETYRTAGQLEEASVTYRKVLRIRSHSAEALFCLGLIKQAQGNADEARSLFEKSLGINPDLAEAHTGLAAILSETGEFDQAIGHCLEAIRINPHYVEAHVSLANLLMHEKNNLELAIRHFEIAASLQPTLPESYYAIGLAWFELNEVERAVECYTKALSMRNAYPEALVALGYCQLSLGNAVKAQNLYEQALELSPELPGALSGLTQTQKFHDPNHPLALRMLQLLEKPEMDASEKSNLHFGLGKLYDDCKKFDLAFGQYEKGNQLARKKQPYDREAEERAFEAICRIFDINWFKRTEHWGNPTELPVFIVGMPRSGTTLTEQIIAAHPAVFGAGEVTYFSRLGARLFPGKEGKLVDLLKSITQDNFNEFCQEYLNKISGFAKQPCLRITDKFPHNFIWLGLIASLFPNAKIIHCRRDVLDNGLSIYFQNFTFGHEYSFDLGDIGHQYRLYQRMMRHWREVLPGRIFELDYESTTVDPEAAARRVVEFCGLEWNDACLSPQKADRAIKTASVSQVRQPIYRTSVQRWKNYEQWLGPLKEALGYES